MLLDLHWWVYLFIVLSIFSVCLLLNYIVKKVNEAKLEERFIRMRQKQSRNQTTQIQGPFIEMEAHKTTNIVDKPQPSQPGISLVFNREENMSNIKSRRDIEETLVKNSTEATKPLTSNTEMNAAASTRVSQNASLNRESINIINKRSAELISLKDSKAVSSFDKIEEDIGPSNFIHSMLENTVTKNISSSHSRHIELQSQKSLVEWIKDWLVPSVAKEDTNIPSKPSSNK